MFGGLLCLSNHVPGDFIEPADLTSALSPHYPPDASGVFSQGAFLLVQATLHAGGANRVGTHLPFRCNESGRLIAFWGRLDDRETLKRVLGYSTSDASNEELVLAAFE